MSKTSKVSTWSAKDYIDRILKRDITALSKAITLVESEKQEHAGIAREILDGVMSHSGKSFRLGITGVPGVGKSSFIEKFGQVLVQKGHRVAVLAVDPSSAKSSGSILGDKTRMEVLSTLPEVYIRPSPAGKALGGVTRSTFESILLCEAAGFDYIIIETVGVGQSEISVSKLCDFFLLLMLAGAGDQLQGIKRGIIEMADALVITKADGDNVNASKSARTEYAQALHFLRQHEDGWIPKALTCSALTGEGISAIYDMLVSYQNQMKSSGHFKQKRQTQLFTVLKESLDEKLLKAAYSGLKLDEKLKALHQKEISNPFAEIDRLMSSRGSDEQ